MRPLQREWLESVFRAVASGDRPDWAVIEWYAQDRYGRLGVFEAVGQPTLRAVFYDLDAYLAAREAVYQLPQVTQANVLVEGARRQTVLGRELAERGLYIFDSWEGNDWQKRYRLAAAPESPLLADHLSEPLLAWFSRMHLKRADFRLAGKQSLDLSGKGMDWVGLAESGAAADRGRHSSGPAG